MSSEFLASSWKTFRGRGTLNHTPGTMRYCFVGKYFVVRFSTTKTTKILPPEKYPLYGIYALCLINVGGQKRLLYNLHDGREQRNFITR